MGINAVPTFVINGRYSISGAQEPRALLAAFDRAAALARA
jgi:predicted DsbA family dithiol-disulfide isomerase